MEAPISVARNQNDDPDENQRRKKESKGQYEGKRKRLTESRNLRRLPIQWRAWNAGAEEFHDDLLVDVASVHRWVAAV
ncbi:MAG TPA: hypothetical protein VKB87_01980 [Myxococcaceae bacterium]|nr:hypothetical protein [Myxococcaceae bacterium]